MMDVIIAAGLYLSVWIMLLRFVLLVTRTMLGGDQAGPRCDQGPGRTPLPPSPPGWRVRDIMIAGK